jgi:hypothetical protein
VKTKDVQLPALREMPESLGGHVIYAPGQVSICPQHQYCAYTGDEPNRCPVCHVTNTRGCAHNPDGGGLPPGRRSPCLCARCGELFTSTSSFNKHMRPVGDDRPCRNPERRGLVLVEQHGWFLWGNPGSPPPRA